jgi:hypothetical protein
VGDPAVAAGIESIRSLAQVLPRDLGESG